ncbi:MAG: histone deacetylase family protein [Gammaproteobacteria bacterium]|nr:histone deacetylase family protein [Gammaproteobacteria bacterium]MDH4315183.1 histone deacetylase family protein [Gammaproteobacteria bacterium]MDH5215326.1 histone deacetylase family protein [Gammaproteobacteria bacterium]MDH5500157.1 histone deacetylase family protein [Gammaproteobacteria bacterium]
MITIFSDDHEQHSGLLEANGDVFVASPECPERANEISRTIRESGIGEMRAPRAFEDRRITAVHSPAYFRFLQQAWNDWQAEGRKGSNARPQAYAGGEMREVEPRSIAGRLGRYAFDDSAPFVAGSWRAIRRSADIALTAADIVRSEKQHVFALCRPPGHHASRERAGGYCYLNNGAIAAQFLRDAGAKKVAVLDIDYHHGNGTQSIFYQRNDVLTVSLHADPSDEYPYFSGYEDEPGEGRGQGFNINFPLPLGTKWKAYEKALQDALARTRGFAPDGLVVALGLDTFADDPTTRFGLATEDYLAMGKTISTMGLPVLTVLEGGYAVANIGRNALAFLKGIEAA